jgi:hypothetical protein
MCLGVNALALVLNVISEKLGCQRLWWLGGIYSPQPLWQPLGRLLAMATLGVYISYFDIPLLLVIPQK